MNQPIALLFPGQGAQYIGMGQDLYETFVEATQVFNLANEVCGFDIKEICFKGPGERLQQTRFAQPAIYTVSMATLAVLEPLLLKKGLQPTVMAGLSLGEATALTAAKVFTLKDGLAFVRNRGLFMDEASLQNPGTMAAIMGIDISVIEPICLSVGVEVANINAPGQIVIAGTKEGVEKASQLLKEAGAKRCMPLEVSGAFHSKCMNPACDRIAKDLENIVLQRPICEVVSNLTGKTHDQVLEIKQNLVLQMNNRTLWQASMQKMIDAGIKLFIEVGPGRVLKGLMKKIDPSIQVLSIGTVADLKEFELGEQNVTR